MAATLLIGQPVGPFVGHLGESHRRTGRDRHAVVDEEAGQHLVGVDGGKRLLGVPEDGEELLVTEVVEVVDLGQVGRRPRSRGRARSPGMPPGAGRCATRPAADAPGAGGRDDAGPSALAR